jgi:hypothetical protein
MRNLLQWCVVFILVSLLALTWWLHSDIIQEPLATMLAAARLEIQRIDIFPIGNDHDAWIFRTRVASAELPLTQRLVASGWRYIDQPGAGWVYEKQDKLVMVMCRLYSTQHMILPGANFFRVGESNEEDFYCWVSGGMASRLYSTGATGGAHPAGCVYSTLHSY